MEVEIYYNNGRSHIYSVDDYILDKKHNLLELYAWYFKSHAKQVNLAAVSKVAVFHIDDHLVLDEVIYDMH